MNVAKRVRLVAVLMYCGVAVLVIVNGQSTTDGDFDNDESSRLVDIVAELERSLKRSWEKSLGLSLERSEPSQ